MEQRAKHDLVRWALRIIDSERRIADQKRRAISEGGDVLGAFEVLRLMEQTLENWRAMAARCSGTFTDPLSRIAQE